MMVSYEFYVNQFHGTAISETEWPGLSARAEEVLARYKRYYRVTGDGEDMAVCAMAEAFQGFGQGLKAAQIGSVSVTFGDNTPRAREQVLYSLASRYLDIYRGRA